MSGRVWAALLAARSDASQAVPDPLWSPDEFAAWSLYSPLLGLGDGRPFLFAQVGQSLDGRVATPAGESRDVSGRDGLIHLHRCRALADAVIVGVGTALADDPRLTVRLADGDNPARIVIDPSGRLDDGATVFRDDGCRRIVVQACGRDRPAGVEIVRLPAHDGCMDAGAVAAALHDLGLRRVLIEGGGTTIGRFLDAGLVNRLHVGIAPLIIGAGRSGLTMRPPTRLAEAQRPRTRVFCLGGDVIFDCAFGTG
ncbi:MAG: RibD family protein [Rhizobiaceae bacterium]|nr:RibD family protein [Rhizobiaceae bacterium]MCV0404812.1 RibD family protein [Rhizobiaceae bacterium]